MVMEAGPILEVEGNGCEKGLEFAKAETENPTRSLTTTVRTTIPGVPVLPVRTDGEIPKGKIMEAMHALSGVTVSLGLDLGDTVVEDLVGSGVRVIAASDLLRRVVTGSDIKNAKLSPGSPGAAGLGAQGFGARNLRPGVTGPDGGRGEGSDEDPEKYGADDAGGSEAVDEEKPVNAGYKPSKGKALLRP